MISLNLLFSVINQNFFFIIWVSQDTCIFIFLNKSIKSLSSAHSFTNLLNNSLKSTTFKKFTSSTLIFLNDSGFIFTCSVFTNWVSISGFTLFISTGYFLL